MVYVSKTIAINQAYIRLPLELETPTVNTILKLKHAFITFLNTNGYVLATLPYTFELNVQEDRQQFGDLTTNIPLILAKKAGQPPRTIAQNIITTFSHPAISKLEIGGAGFINFFLTPAAIITIATELAQQGSTYCQVPTTDGITQKFNIEFVSANPTGPLHLGHGRGGIIGDVLGNIMGFIGYQVTKEHYINDAGSQIAKLGTSLRIRCQQAQGQDVELAEDAYHGHYLIDVANTCLQEYPDALNRDDEFFKTYAYHKMLTDLKKTTSDYGINFDVWFSEKTLHTGAIERAIDRLTTNQKTYIHEDALWFKSTDYGDDKDRVLKKADGSYTYAAADAAYMLNKYERGFNHLILVLGQDHHSYPKRLEGMRQALGLHDVQLNVILYQLVSIQEEGLRVRMSKRAGTMIGLQDIIDTVGKDVARFFYLNRKADAHLEFDINLALEKNDQNPVYYLQYAYVRTRAILQRAQEHPDFANIQPTDCAHLTDAEKLLIKKLAALQPLLHDIAHNYQVHLLTYYLLELAHLFHNYYHHNKVLEPASIEQSRGRLLLVTLVKQTFEHCFELIGITAPESM